MQLSALLCLISLPSASQEHWTQIRPTFYKPHTGSTTAWSPQPLSVPAAPPALPASGSAALGPGPSEAFQLGYAMAPDDPARRPEVGLVLNAERIGRGGIVAGFAAGGASIAGIAQAACRVAGGTADSESLSKCSTEGGRRKLGNSSQPAHLAHPRFDLAPLAHLQCGPAPLAAAPSGWAADWSLAAAAATTPVAAATAAEPASVDATPGGWDGGGCPPFGLAPHPLRAEEASGTETAAGAAPASGGTTRIMRAAVPKEQAVAAAAAVDTAADVAGAVGALDDGGGDSEEDSEYGCLLGLGAGAAGPCSVAEQLVGCCGEQQPWGDLSQEWGCAGPELGFLA
jgi:hypothetical protein